MSSSTIITMIISLSQSLVAVQQMVAGFAYVVGIAMILNALWKWMGIVNAGRPAPGKHTSIIFSLVGGAGLLFMPSLFEVVSSTAFGSSENLLQYSAFHPQDLYAAMAVIIHTVGLVWFFRGVILLTHSGEPNAQAGSKGPGRKGLSFLCAGAFAMNFQSTLAALSSFVNNVMYWFGSS